MQSTTFGRLCITHRIDLRWTYSCPKKGIHYNGYNGGIFGPFQYEILNLNKDYLSLYYTDDNYTLNFKKTD